MKITALLNEDPIPVKPVQTFVSGDNRISSLPNGLETLFWAVEHSTAPKAASWKIVLNNVIDNSPAFCAPNISTPETLLASRKRSLEVTRLANKRLHYS